MDEQSKKTKDLTTLSELAAGTPDAADFPVSPDSISDAGGDFSLPPISEEALSAAQGLGIGTAGLQAGPIGASEGQPEGLDVNADLEEMAPSFSLSDAPIDSPTNSLTPDEPEVTAPPPVAVKISESMENIKAYSDQTPPVDVHVPASVPFSLMIVGRLKEHEKEKLLMILSRENLGIREVELEHQFAAGRILIPRISEYAGVVLLQALRNANVSLRLGPSEQIFASREAHEDPESELAARPSANTYSRSESAESDADRIPISTQSIAKPFQVIDTLHASMNIKSSQLGASVSDVFEESLEALKRQLKHRAFHKQATHLIHFRSDLIPVNHMQSYKLVVQATAVRLQSN